MGCEQTLELLLSGCGIWLRQRRAPQPPWWGKALRRVLALSFWLVGRTVFRVRVRGLEHFTNEPATLIVTNHKSDFDLLLLVPALSRAHGGQGPIRRLAFVAAERMFQPAYFSTYLLPRPRWLSRLLYPVNLSAALQGLHAYPIGHARRRKLGAHLRALRAWLGNAPLQALFAHAVEDVLPGIAKEARIEDALRWRFVQALDAEYDFSIFKPELEKKLREHHLEGIFRDLARFAALLDQGDPLFLAPEGDLSHDGSLGQLKAALPRLIGMTQAALKVLPVHLTYDTMATGRATAFVSIGPQLDDVQRWPKAQLKKQIRQRIQTLGTITLPQLAASCWSDPPHCPWLELQDLKVHIQDKARRLHGEGFLVDDQLLSPGAFDRRWRRFLRHGRRKGLFRLNAGQLRPRMVTPWEYYRNEFQSIVGNSSA